MYSNRNSFQCHQKSDLLRLQGMAEGYINSRKRSMCRYLYRNKSEKYFNDILNGNGVMTTYIKDASGDPKSPINNQINGLFFFASVKLGSTTGEPMEESAFGPKRLVVPIEKLVNYSTDHLYFADFFCMRGKRHYVTLVLTKSGSFADRFCSTRLPELSLTRNDFFFFNTQINTFRVNTSYNFFVEIFYTENVNVKSLIWSDSWITDVPTVCNGRSTYGGVKKNPYCSTCNLPAASQTVTDSGYYSYSNSTSYNTGHSTTPIWSSTPATINTGSRVLTPSTISRPTSTTISATVSTPNGNNRNDSWNSTPRLSTTSYNSSWDSRYERSSDNANSWSTRASLRTSRQTPSSQNSWCTII